MSLNGNLNVKQVRVDVTAHERGPGWAWLVLSGVNATPDVDAQAVRLSLQRNQDSRFLDEQAGWSASEVWHCPLEVTVYADQARVSLLIGPELVDELLADPRTVCRIQVQYAGEAAWAGVLRMGSGIYPSGAAGQVPSAVRQVHAAPVDPVPEAATPQEDAGEKVPFVAVRPELPTRSSPTRKMPILLLLLMLALLGLAIAWYAGFPDRWIKAPGPGSQVSSVSTEQPVSLATGPCSQEVMRATPDDLVFLQACVQGSPDAEQVLAVVQAGKDAGRCDLIQRLYAYAAQAGDARVALTYAREFDPQTFKGGCFDQADAPTALYWYEKALQLDPDQTTVAERVSQLKKDLEVVQ